MQIEFKAVLYGCAVDLGDQSAGPSQCLAVKAGSFAYRSQFIRRAARMFAAPAADVDPEFALQRRQSAFQGADHAGRDAGRVPVHAHHGAKGLKPERMRQPLQEFVSPVVMNHRLGDDCAQGGHALGQPWRHAAAMEGKVGAASSSCHRVPGS